MARFTIETTYDLPVYRHRSYEAGSAEDACRLALEDESWEDAQSDCECAGKTYVTGTWANTDTTYQGETMPTPEHLDETVQRKADIFDALLTILKEPARPMELSRQEFENWLPRALDVIARAESVVGE